MYLVASLSLESTIHNIKSNGKASLMQLIRFFWNLLRLFSWQTTFVVDLNKGKGEWKHLILYYTIIVIVVQYYIYISIF
jgi:hypothetical protein